MGWRASGGLFKFASLASKVFSFEVFCVNLLSWLQRYFLFKVSVALRKSRLAWRFLDTIQLSVTNYEAISNILVLTIQS